ncbi:hypothetical protein G6F46_006848 [Rhizopus delemar]|uniref:Fork-head domain-containing protein n=2 Tax=Rhizopus TaxID=4842 RepID=A0A9P6Z7Z1_9FUNG|nr:hypothetical protein G6F55_002779 [Rhizopus delemar]KAG1543019.1 hypothetical protein G6F51_006927 [Rhizopus arrhizus]KAG1496942.1 hypothetical protein G6F54_006120 [Rhizopus delemar]KAG1513048.1 hypothetical protein G6F53_004726 [Rhizopus delemar]KAG1524137.1 hypothetical protein G6F52_004443 [Rhizopus delemar]
MSSNEEDKNKKESTKYLPPIPVLMRYPTLIASVKQYKLEQKEEYIVSESFIPVAPNVSKPPKKRRRPPFSYSSLIAQAILASENERMTLRDIYNWIINKYPTLYNAQDTGWQNTIRHNLSLNRCFKKVPKDELDEPKGKGGYWTIDPSYMEKFKNGSFTRGASTLMRKKEPFIANDTLPSSTNTENEPYRVMKIHNLLN